MLDQRLAISGSDFDQLLDQIVTKVGSWSPEVRFVENNWCYKVFLLSEPRIVEKQLVF